MDPRAALGPIRRDYVRTFLDAMVTLPYDSRVATRWGEIQAYAQLRGRPRPANDSWIAACCLVRARARSFGFVRPTRCRLKSHSIRASRPAHSGHGSAICD